MPTVAFCLDDKPAYLMHLKVAVRSLRALYPADQTPDVICVYAGNAPEILDGLRAEGIPLARYSPVLRPEELSERCRRVAGCFLKLELALVPELAGCSTVLYCDTDVLFLRRPDPLFALSPAYMAMSKEDTLPFNHPCETLRYTWRGHVYTVRLPFPIWTFNSGVAVFNLDRLRRNAYVHNFLAFCQENAERIGNFDQSLLNYFFGKRITRLEPAWNCPPYRINALTEGAILHFQGPKPWEVRKRCFKDLRVNDYDKARALWKTWLTPDEAAVVQAWEAADPC